MLANDATNTAAVASPLVSREALFEQAGIIATPGFGELIEACALLAAQPDFILANGPQGPDDAAAAWSRYRLLDAVRAGRIAVIDPASFSAQSLRVAAAARQVCAALAGAFGATPAR